MDGEETHLRFNVFTPSLRYNNDGVHPLNVPGIPEENLSLDPDLSPHQIHSRQTYNDNPRDTSHLIKLCTARELAMLQLMEDFTDLPNWPNKARNEAYMLMYRERALRRPLISEAAWQWCLSELKDKANYYHVMGIFNTLNVQIGMCKTDTAVPSELLDKLAEALAFDVESSEVDQNAHTTKQIDPALFPMIFDRSLVLHEAGRVETEDLYSEFGRGRQVSTQASRERRQPYRVEPIRETNNAARDVSLESQWLPFEVALDKGKGKEITKAYKITSYINNVHPRDQQDVYAAIQDLLPTAVSMWNEVLVYDNQPRFPRRINADVVSWLERPWKDLAWIKDPNLLRDPAVLASALSYIKKYVTQPHTLGGLTDTRPPAWEDLPAALLEEIVPKWCRDVASALVLKLDNEYYATREWKHPQPGVATTYQQWQSGHASDIVTPERPPPDPHRSADHQYYTVAIEKSLRAHGLQVIASASSLDLLPSDPRSKVEHPGSAWRRGGLENEHIVATVRVYYAVSNVVDPALAFRQCIPNDLPCGDHDPHVSRYLRHDGFNESFPLLTEGNGRSQRLGSVLLRSGRVIAWPNAGETRHEPFALHDISRPGHVRWLQLSLVDPHYRITSTRNVPPQQGHWWLPDALAVANLSQYKLPQEVIDIIVEHLVDWPMGMAEALRHKHTMDYERGEMSIPPL